MTFSQSSNTITQSGTDDDFTPNEGQSGIETQTVGSTTRQKKSYKLNQRRIVASGVLLIPEKEELRFEENAPSDSLEVTGELNLGVESIINGAVRSPDWTPLTFTRPKTSGSLDGDRDLEVTGIFRQYGGLVKSSGVIGFEAAATEILLQNCKYIGEHTSTTRIRQRCSNLTILNLITEGSIRVDFYIPAVSIIGFKPTFTALGGFQVLSSAAGGSDDIFVFRELDGEGLTYVADAFRGARLELINTVYEPQMLITHNARTSTDSFYPITLMKKEFIIKAVDNTGVLIPEGVYGFEDVNNGNRPTQEARWNGGVTGDYRNTLVYTGAITNGLSTQREFISETIREGLSPGGQYGVERAGWLGSATTLIDSRTNADRRINIPVRSYLLQSGIINGARMHGKGVATFEIAMLPDLFVSETNPETVAAYMGITLDFTTNTVVISENHTLDEIYDFIKHAMTRLSNVLRPEFAIGNGNVLNLSHWDFVIGVNKRVTSGTKFNAITTTGDIPNKEGAEVAITDSSGTLMTISVNVSNASLWYTINDGTGQYDSVSANGRIRLVVPQNAIVKATIKAQNYSSTYREFNTSTSLQFNVELVREPNVDPGAAIEVSDTAIRFNYNDQSVSKLEFDGINISGRLEESKRIWDREMTTAAGLEFQHKYGKRPRAKLHPDNGDPTGIIFSNKSYFVTDRTANKIFVYNENFIYLRQFNLNNLNQNALDISSGPTENKLYVLDATDRSIYRYDENGTYEGVQVANLFSENSSPRGLTYRTRWYVSDYIEHTIYAYSDTGSHESAEDVPNQAGNLSSGLDSNNSEFYLLDLVNSHHIIRQSNTALLQRFNTNVSLKGIALGSRVIPGNADRNRESFIVSITNQNEFIIFSQNNTNTITERNTSILQEFSTILNGRPYEIFQNEIVINGDYIDFVKKSSVTILQISQWGIAMKNRSENIRYDPPILSNGDVRIDNPTEVDLVKTSTAVNVVEAVTRSLTYIDAIKTPLAADIVQQIQPEIAEIGRDITEIDEKLGNTIQPTQIYDIGGTEHGQLGVPNISALARVFSVTQLFEPNTTKIHIDIDQVSREGTGPDIDFDLDIYALENIDSIDVAEPFSSTAKYDAFRTANESRRIFHQDEDSHVTGRHTVIINSIYNRFAVLFRNNNPANSTLIFRFNEFRISLHDAILNITEHVEEIREKTDSLIFTGTGEESKVNAVTDAILPDMIDLTATNTKIDAVKADTEILMAGTANIKAKTDKLHFTDNNKVHSDLQAIKEIDAGQLTTQPIRLNFIFGVSPTNPNHALDDNDDNYSQLSQDPTQYSSRLTTFAIYKSEIDILPDHLANLRMNLDGVVVDPGGPVTTGWIFEIYLLQDVDTLHFSSSADYNMFRSNNASRRAYSINHGGHARLITLNPTYRFNRVLVMFRHAEFTGTTLHARYDNLKITINNVIKSILTVGSDTRSDVTELKERLTTEVISRLDAPVSSRLAGDDYVSPDNTKIAAIEARATESRLEHLDADISSRLPNNTPVNVDRIAGNNISGVDDFKNDLTDVTTKLNEIDTRSSNIENTTNTIESTTNAINSRTNTIEAVTNNSKVVIDNIEDHVENIEDHVENDSIYNPTDSTLTIKSDDKTEDIAIYDIKDENNMPTGTGTKAYRKIKR